MTRGLLAVAVASGLLAGCAKPTDMFSAGQSTPATFTYVAESYDLFPARRYEGEVRRLQDLQQYLASNNLCGEGYEVDSREEAAQAGNMITRSFHGTIFRVTYRGHCKYAGMPAAPEPPAPDTALPATPGYVIPESVAPAPDPMYSPASPGATLDPTPSDLAPYDPLRSDPAPYDPLRPDPAPSGYTLPGDTRNGYAPTG